MDAILTYWAPVRAKNERFCDHALFQENLLLIKVMQKIFIFGIGK